MTGPIPNVEQIAPFRPLPWQVAPWRDTSPVMLLTGSAGGGKSRLAAEKVVGFCRRYPGAQGLVLRKTREAMTNSTLLFLERVVIGDDPSVRYLASKLRFEFDNGSILSVGGMADEEQREQIRSVGQQGGVDIAWLEEANAFEEDDYNEVLARMRGTAASWRQVILTTNPDFPDHWIATRLIRDKEASVYYSSAADNSHNPAEYRASLQKLTGVLKQRLADGLWVAGEGTYFTEWDPAVHVCAPFDVPKDWTRWLSVDYGFADPWCVLWYARSPRDRRVYIYRESYATGVRDEQQAQIIREKSAGERIAAAVGDPSMWGERRELGLPSIAQKYLQAGIPLTPASNNRRQGWATVRRALAHHPETGVAPRLQVLRDRAPNLVRTLPAMVHDPLDAEDLADAIKGKKTEDHAVDCLRYGLVAEAQPPATIRVMDFQVLGN